MQRIDSFGAGLLFAAILAWSHGPAAAADAALVAAAQKEGRVTWYTTQIVNQFAAPAAAAFEKKYGIKVDYVREDPNEVVLRIWSEGKAGQMQADVFDSAPVFAGVNKVGLVAPWLPDEARRLPPEDYDPQGYWTATNFYVLTPAFNTRLVPKGSEPRTFADLLDPKWKGHMAWCSQPTVSGAPGLIAVVLASMGEDKGMDYLRRFAAQEPVPIAASPRAVLDQVIAGEHKLAVMIYNHHVAISAAQGAPIAWVKLEPLVALFTMMGVLKDAPHPNAARLLEEFILSAPGQQVMAANDYLPADPDVEARIPELKPEAGHFAIDVISPDQVRDGLASWIAIYHQLFR